MGEKTTKKQIALTIKTRTHTLTCLLEKKNKCWYPKDYISNRSKKTDDETVFKKITLKQTWDVSKKKRNRKSFEKECQLFCDFPFQTDCPKEVATIQLMILLSQVSSFLVGKMAAIPQITLNDVPEHAKNLLEPLLNAIQGDCVWKEKNWNLSRNWVLSARMSFRETKPSESMRDYIDGKYEGKYYKKKTFCFPYHDCSVLMMPDLPPKVARDIMHISPLSLFITFSSAKYSDGRPVLMFGKSCLNSYQEDFMKEFEKRSRKSYCHIQMFLKWFFKEEQVDTEWESTCRQYRHINRSNGYTQLLSTKESEYLCAAMTIFNLYLKYATDQDWIKPDKAKKIFNQYWKLLVPESFPKENQDKGTEKSTQISYDDPNTFYEFLSCYLEQHKEGILKDDKGIEGTVGIIYRIKNEDEYSFITPRDQFFGEYKEWLKGRGTCDPERPLEDSDLQKQLIKNRITFKTESNDKGNWRFQFYNKKLTGHSEKIPCLAIRISLLPKHIQDILQSL